MKADWSTFWPKVVDATGETVYMVLITLALSTVLGLAVGLALYATRKGGVLPNRLVHAVLGTFINVIRPVPFIIAIVALAPVTRAVVGTMIGTDAAVFPMTIVATFGIARIVESNLLSVEPGVIEAARSMGAGPLRILLTVLVPEALGPLVLGLTFMLVALIDFSAVAGTVGGGGVGNLAMTYGYLRFDTSVMVVTVLVLIALVQSAQFLGDRVSRRILRR
ncbi:methionine ABC transporter permease [Streptomyces lavendulae]|uniref:D-methionine transport system permease protein MetI n=1 Tax=Streptomyces lavendulae subsp. lavendulae TaxID=58340 RepID=A0A2K8PP90_STRLA|nr:methionine ABC transporter permease [Streptomyces lavendulae]ATZ28557.1 D-methionine transport system permease protein MetI [Streptomyces lavendulae subsp. lavendulae]QUQ58382.1 D-methionine transport system permease protein MetI [Streptomyces lavendulae subsp. lavendulae]GLV99139.1 ABC transporter permease [Streptomyces lavendulae subsp. lavendulae]